MRLCAAKLTRSSVYTLIGTHDCAIHYGAIRVTGHRGNGGRPPACGTGGTGGGFLFLPSSLCTAPAEEFARTKPKSVRRGNGVYVRHERTSTKAFPAILSHRRSRFPPSSSPAVEKGGIASARAGFPATDSPGCRPVTFGRIYWKGTIVKFEIARAIGTLKLQSRYKLIRCPTMSHPHLSFCIMYYWSFA